MLIAEEFGGQSIVSEGIENWIGTEKLSGEELKKSLKKHLDAYKGDILDIEEGRVEMLEKTADGFRITTAKDIVFEARAVLIASGASRRKLQVPGADTFENKGVTYCASCDGPLFADQDVAVVGGGNAGLETAAQLLAYAKSVTLIHRHSSLKADPITIEKVLAHPNMKVLYNYEPIEVTGEKFVNGLVARERATSETITLPITGVFVEIGVMPSTGFAAGLVDLDPVGRIVTDPKNQHTSIEGIWAAGDCTDELYHQNNIAAGDAVKALEDIYLWVKMR